MRRCVSSKNYEGKKGGAFWSYRLAFCFAVAALFLYLNIDRQNELTEVRLRIPQLERELKELNEENKQLTYTLDQWQNPAHLMELMRKPEYAHLHYPDSEEVILR